MKKLRIIAAALALTTITSMSAYAGTWQKNAQGWWYDNGDGTWPASTWQWIDGNNDGIAECYYFDANGYCLTNTLTPDAYTVNADGAWTIYGQVQTKNLSSENTVTSDFPKLDGLYHDTNWNHYYLVHTKEDGTLLVYLRNTDGSEGELYMEMTYLGDNRWSDGNGSVFSNNAWVTEGENFHVSMGGYVQREMIKQ